MDVRTNELKIQTLNNDILHPVAPLVKAGGCNTAVEVSTNKMKIRTVNNGS